VQGATDPAPFHGLVWPDGGLFPLLAEQRPDGGWAQLSTLASDAYATRENRLLAWSEIPLEHPTRRWIIALPQPHDSVSAVLRKQTMALTPLLPAFEVERPLRLGHRPRKPPLFRSLNNLRRATRRRPTSRCYPEFGSPARTCRCARHNKNGFDCHKTVVGRTLRRGENI
jgi:hypothetical protein